MNKIEVGILGATGMVGQNFIKFLEGHPWFEVTWLGASDRSAGKKYRDACKWNLNGVSPESVRDRVVEEWIARGRQAARHPCIIRYRRAPAPRMQPFFRMHSRPAATPHNGRRRRART